MGLLAARDRVAAVSSANVSRATTARGEHPVMVRGVAARGGGAGRAGRARRGDVRVTVGVFSSRDEVAFHT